MWFLFYTVITLLPHFLIELGKWPEHPWEKTLQKNLSEKKSCEGKKKKMKSNTPEATQSSPWANQWLFRSPLIFQALLSCTCKRLDTPWEGIGTLKLELQGLSPIFFASCSKILHKKNV